MQKKGRNYGCQIYDGEFNPLQLKKRLKRDADTDENSISGVVYDTALSMYMPEVRIF